VADPTPLARWTALGGIPIRFRLGSYAVQFRGFGFIRPSQWKNEPHQHAFFEICYAYAGRGRFRMLGSEHQVRRGEVFIAKPGENHQIVSSEQERLGICFWSYTLTRDAGGGPDSEIDGLLRDFLESRQWVSSRVPGMRRTIELLIEEAVRAEAGNSAAINGLAAKLVLDTARAGVELRRAAPGQEPERGVVERARGFILDNLARPLAVGEIAAQVGLSERHLTRLFRRVTGRSPMGYLAQRRVEAASQLLVQGVPIKEVAARLGFSGVRYFTTVFRRAIGAPPAKFRARGGTTQVGNRRRP
jgi:AraC family L-rhamnose operon transcriptional activator RhaR